MKTKLLIPIIFLLLLGCRKDKITEVPNGTFVIKPCSTLVDSIMGLLPEGKNTYINYPIFFSDTVQKKLVLIKESEVYVSFINEGAGNKNSLCWYSYNNSQTSLNINNINGNVLFPNISKKGEGGELELGYTLQLGNAKFPAGTVIGFFLVVNGWKKGTIDYAGPIYYTDYQLNVNGKQQSILFKEVNCDDIVIGFEDWHVDGFSDKDYNDILFSVSDNKEGYITTSFDLSKVVVK